MDRSLIVATGTSGFVGPHLVDCLRETGADLECWNQTLAGVQKGIRQVEVDVRDGERVAALMKASQPSCLIHLAAISHVPTSFAQPELTWAVNVMGTLNLLEAVRMHSPETRVLYISSSEVYGPAVSVGTAHDENTRLAPGNPYAASKAAADLMVQQYGRNGMDVLVARPFNHTGPGQLPEFVLPAFATQIALIETGQQDAVIHVGNLDVERDFLDVRDVVKAYLALIAEQEAGHGGVFNVCSGEPRNLHRALSDLIELSGTQVDIEVDPNRFRPNDAPVVFGENSRLCGATGWKPKIDWQVTLSDLLDDARARLGQ